MAEAKQLFVGRDRELRQLASGFADAAAGRGALFLVAGPPGVGKTTLAEALCEHARGEGATTLWGRCWENAGAPAYWPWVQALRGYARERDPDALRAEAGSGTPYLARLVPELAAQSKARGDSPELGSEQARFALFQAVADLLRAAGAARPIVLVLDDLHAADPSSLLMLRFVARDLEGTRLLAIGMYRDLEARRDQEVGALLGELEREGRAMSLGGLSEHETGRMVTARTRTPASQELVASLQEVTEGNPFFLTELVRLLETQGRLEARLQPDAPPLPAGVRETITHRLDYLPDDARGLLRGAAVIGRQFSLRLLAALGGIAPAEALELLEPGLELGLVKKAGAGPGGLRFSHALVRETLYGELSRAERLSLHHRAGEAIESLRAADLEPHFAELAHHFLEAAPAGDQRKGTDYAILAGKRADRVFAHEDAARHFERALAALELGGGGELERRCDIALALGDARWRAGQTADAKRTFIQAGALARELGSSERLGRAAIGFGGRFAWVEATGVVDDELVELLEAALEAQPPGDSALKAEVMARLSMMLYFSPAELSRREALADDAVAMTRRLGDPSALAYALNAKRFTLWHSSRIEQRLAVAAELVDAARVAQETELAMRGHAWTIVDLLEQGDIGRAEVAAGEHARLTEELRQPLYHADLVKWRAMRALLAGQLDDAERLLAKLGAAADRVQDPDIIQAYGIHLFVMRGLQGRLDEVAPLIEGYVAQFPAISSWRASLAFLYTELRREDDARELYERIIAEDSLEQQAGSWAIGVAMLAEVCAFLGDVERAPKLYKMLLPYEKLSIVIGYAAACFGAAGRSLGILARTMGRFDAAERHFLDAIELNERLGARVWLAWSKADYARLLAERNQPGDSERVERLLDEVIRSAEKTQAARIAEKAAEVGWQAEIEARVTLLFSDIEGSTAITRQIGDRAWLELLRRHNALVRAQISAHGGFEVKTQGDGFMVAFSSERRALDCAIAVQRAFAELPPAEAGTRLRLRIGLHTGEALRDAGDFYGTNVNLAARVAAAAGAGEVLVSQPLRERVRGEAYEFERHRSEELKGLPGTYHLYAVRW